MAQSRGSKRGMVQVALTALLAAAGAMLAATGCSSEVSEGSGGSEPLGAVRQALLCTNPSNGSKIDCGSDTDCRTVKCSKVGNGCLYEPVNDGAQCKSPSGDLGVCAAAVCCTGCVRVNKLTREVTCEKGTTNPNCGIGGNECDSCVASACSNSQCNAEKGKCETTTVPDKEPCNDNSGLCLNGSCCRGCLNSKGECVAGNTVNECGKTTVDGFATCEDCDKGNTCSNYSCVSGVCAAPTPKPGACPDGNLCNGQEACGNNTCNPGTPLSCTDNDPCTNNDCDPVKGCTTSPNTGANCTDNNLCTITDKCAAGTCKGTGAPNCDDNNPCTIDDCDPAKGCTHTPVPDNDPCSDGNECSTGDKCVGGKCLASGGKLCDDNNACTKNECDPASQAQDCSFQNEDDGTACVHANKCKQNSTCQNGSCAAGTDIVCDDGNPCTKNECDPNVGCVFPADDTASCSDGDACTADDACKNKVCEGTPIACTALDECHVPGTCNPETGKCDDQRAEDGTECHEGGPGTCDSGKCVLLPIGGAGGESATGEGGEPAALGGNGSTAEGGSSEPGASAGGAGATPSAEGGSPGEPGDEDVRAFVRQPGGCSCSVPASPTPSGAAWLAGLSLASLLARRRRGQGRQSQLS